MFSRTPEPTIEVVLDGGAPGEVGLPEVFDVDVGIEVDVGPEDETGPDASVPWEQQTVNINP